MGKAKRIKAERAAGTRKENGKRWETITPGMFMVIPTWKQVRMGAAPLMVPTDGRVKETPNMAKFQFIRQAMKFKPVVKPVDTPSMSLI